ncbi:hypothetical protein ACFL96_06720 [Thermoproteota archaeon]
MSRGKRGLKQKVLRRKNASMRDEILYIIFQVMMVVFVGLMVFTYINNKTTSIGFEKRYIAMDMGLSLTAVYASPGNLIYRYTKPIELTDEENYTIEMAMERTRVLVKEPKDKLATSYYYGGDLTIPRFFKRFTKWGDPFPLYRFGYDLDTDITLTNYNKISCPPIARPSEDEDNPKPSWRTEKKIYFDITSKNRTDPVSQRETKVGDRLKTVLKNKQRLTITDDIEEADIAIGLRIMRRTEQGSITAHIPDSESTLKESRTLACSLINELLTPETFVKYVQILPVAGLLFDRNESWWLDMLWGDDITKLKTSKITIKESQAAEGVRVIIEFGIVDESQMDFENTANAIFNALSRFYGSESDLMTTGPTISAELLSTTMQALAQDAAPTTAGVGDAQQACTNKSEEIRDFPFHDSTFLKAGQINGGRLWIPAQANCPGKYPLIILLHDVQKDPPRYIHAGINRGKPGEGGMDVTKAAKEILDAGKARPFMIAAPSQSNADAASSAGLWRGFDTGDFIQSLISSLPAGVSIGPVIVIGQGGAGCNLNGGIHSAIKSSYKPYILVQSDTCLNGAYGRDLMVNIGSGTRFFSLFIPEAGAWGSSRESSSPSFQNGWDEQNAVMGITTDVACPDYVHGSITLDNCRKASDKDWFSVPVRGVTATGQGSAHTMMQEVAIRFVTTQFLPPAAGQASTPPQPANTTQQANGTSPGQTPQTP